MFFNTFANNPIYDIAEALRTSQKWRETFRDYQSPIIKHTAETYREILSYFPRLTIQALEEGQLVDTFYSRAGMEQHLKSWLPHYKYLQGGSPKST